MRGKAYYCTVEELQKRGRDDIPEQFRSNTHLIYSSPATLAFNSPGAEGFGVKRAGLAIPDSVMLIVAPGCCGARRRRRRRGAGVVGVSDSLAVPSISLSSMRLLTRQWRGPAQACCALRLWSSRGADSRGRFAAVQSHCPRGWHRLCRDLIVIIAHLPKDPRISAPARRRTGGFSGGRPRSPPRSAAPGSACSAVAGPARARRSDEAR